MGTKLNKTTYENEIKIHVEELCKHMKRDTLERRFIIQVLQDSVKCYYVCDGKETPTESGNCIKPVVTNHVCRTCKGTQLVYIDEKIGNTLCPDC